MDPSSELSRELQAAQPGLRRFCASIARDTAEADDLIQEVLLAALTQRSLDLSKPLTPWLKRVARNIAIDRYRGTRKEELTEVEPIQHAAPQQERLTELARGATVAWLHLLGSLKPKARAVLLCRDLLDLTVAETATTLGMGESNVKVTLHRARTHLRNSHGKAAGQRDRRALDSVLEFRVGPGLTGPRTMIGANSPDGLNLCDAAWTMWSSLLNTAESLAVDDPELQARTLMARMRTQTVDGSYDLDGDIVRADELARQLDHPTLAAQLQLVVGTTLLGLGRLAEAEQVFHALSNRASLDPDTAAATSMGMAGLHWRNGRFHEAAAAYEHASTMTDDPLLLSCIGHNIALVQGLAGELDQCLEKGHAAVQRFVDAGEHVSAARTMGAIGLALQNYGRLDDAEDAFRRAATSYDRQRALGLSNQNNLGLIHVERGELDRALRWFTEVADEARTKGNVRSEAIAWANHGVTAHLSGLLDRAGESLARSEKICIAEDMTHLHAFVLGHQAAVMARQGDPRAHDHIRRALALSSQLGDPNLERILQALHATLDGGPEPVETWRALQEHATRFCALRIALSVLHQSITARQASAVH